MTNMTENPSGLPVCDVSAFRAACEKAARSSRASHAIGTLGEKNLHASLKWYYEPDGSRHEIPVGSYVADIAGACGIVEIQTRRLSALKPKLKLFLETAPVTVVHPVILRKRIVNIDSDTGEILSSRMSPRHASLYSAVPEIYTLREYLFHEQFTLRLPLLEVEERRLFGVRTRQRKKQRTRRGEYVSDRIPTAITGEVILRRPSDYAVFLPPSLPSPFGAAELGQVAHIELSAAQRTIRLLTLTGVTECIGKDGRRLLYQSV